MNKPNGLDIRTSIERRHKHDLEEIQRREDVMNSFAADAARSFAAGLNVAAEDSAPPFGPAGVDRRAAQAAAAQAIEARREQSASTSPLPRTGEPQLRAALRGIVEDYAQPLTPPDRTVRELDEQSGEAVESADPAGLWVDVRLAESLAVREGMRDVVDRVTERVESVIVAEVLAAGVRLACEYPEAPRAEAAPASHRAS